MSYLTWQYYLLIIITAVIYYILPLSVRWVSLLAGSVCFYTLFSGNRAQLIVFLLTILFSYGLARLLEARRIKQEAADAIGKSKNRSGRLLLAASVILCAAPLLIVKVFSFAKGFTGRTFSELIVPIGISFYTIQIIAYLADVHAGKTAAEKNPLRYTLFVSFFPQIVQGPIPRFAQLQPQLRTGHRLDFENIKIGFYRILWGSFLKYMIADKAAVYVNEIFDNYRIYSGTFILTAAVLYSLQLYTDFLACVMISRGSARLFGIELPENFMQPYLAVSIRDFWRRWHMTLSSFLRDYVYIPLGGSRKGRLRRQINLLLTFLVSGFWHGDGLHFIAWGLLNGVYQMIGGWTAPLRAFLYRTLGIGEESLAWRLYKRVNTFALVTLAWMLFRCPTIRQALIMFRNMVTVWNPWVLFDGSIEKCGSMNLKQWHILQISLALLAVFSLLQEKYRASVRDPRKLSHEGNTQRTEFRNIPDANVRSHVTPDASAHAPAGEIGTDVFEAFSRQHVTLRFLVCLGMVLFIMLFGTYGYGFSAGSFIYGGF